MSKYKQASDFFAFNVKEGETDEVESRYKILPSGDLFGIVSPEGDTIAVTMTIEVAAKLALLLDVYDYAAGQGAVEGDIQKLVRKH